RVRGIVVHARQNPFASKPYLAVIPQIGSLLGHEGACKAKSTCMAILLFISYLASGPHPDPDLPCSYSSFFKPGRGFTPTWPWQNRKLLRYKILPEASWQEDRAGAE